MKAYVSTLGCAKNLVDTEASLALLGRSGCAATSDPDEADLLIVNACSFLDLAWRETLEEVERLGEVKRKGHGKTLVLMGCLPKHRTIDLETSLPYVDHFLPTGAHERLGDIVRAHRGAGAAPRTIERSGADPFAGFESRTLLTPPHTAYVKIAEGCSRACTFCAIPMIRGHMVSRAPDTIVGEVETLMARGVREVSLLAQDITSYSADGVRFPELVERIAATGIDWIRIYYVHPASLTPKLARRLFRIEAVCRYLECPVQHASDRILRAMRRSYTGERLSRVFGEIRSEFPDLRIRSEVIVGFPGEEEEDFAILKAFLERIEFASLGIFRYSPEAGTPAAALAGQVPEEVKWERADEITDLQRSVSLSVHDAEVGRHHRILVDRRLDPSERSNGSAHTHAGRYYGQALEVDGEVRLAGRNIASGGFVTARITGADVYDLEGEVI